MPTALTDLCRHPIVQAPMAGGAASPVLAAAVCEAGGLGFLAAGYKTADGMYQEIKQLRGLTGRPFGVNVFMPQPPLADVAAVEVYREQLAGESSWYQTPLEEIDPCGGVDDGYEAKLAILREDPVPVVSFTFGCPSRAVFDAFARIGTYTVVTATTAAEAQAAQWSGADAVCVQGIEAGGHQGTHRDDPHADATGAGMGLLSLVAQVREAVQIPVIATGGLMRGSQIAAVLAAGASMAQLGTAFLATPESGAHVLHKQALTNPLFTRTELTRAFSGRPARGLVNRFMREHGPYAPAAYPAVHHLTSGLRKAAAKAGDAQGMALWAGQGHRMARELPAGELIEVLMAELEATRQSLRAGDVMSGGIGGEVSGDRNGGVSGAMSGEISGGTGGDISGGTGGGMSGGMSGDMSGGMGGNPGSAS
ncbi:nitronate monooxygenase [Streptomyces sp. MST-110588]|uniref:nitronate monooxygenase n=1 Tax=Streptomyces sp. MST-110588 TaxID=2833628 RepID=UPI001F5DCFE5|nr:nitronate monooxygenase [Streptomyces sp. MST-110588]UNO42056.1 nitronate monooxygenase [Streptomyces sp. MST-110588]